MMAPWLIMAVAVVYTMIGADLIRTGKLGLGLAFLGYAFSNIGLYMAAKA